MSTFNAGAIEANLTLGRSSWVRDLKTTQREIRDLENTTITIAIDADADNALIAMSNVEALAEDFDGTTYSAVLDMDDRTDATLQQLDEKLDQLDQRNVTFMVDADTDNAQVGISLLNEELDSLDRDTVTVPIDVDTAQATTDLITFIGYLQSVSLMDIDVTIDLDVQGYPTAIARLATLEAQADAMDGRTIDIDLDVDNAALASLVGSSSGGGGGGGHLGLLRIALYAIIALAPILGVATGAMVASIVALSAAIAGALGPVLLLAGGIAGLVGRFKEAQEADELTPMMERLADALDAVDEAWNGFLDDIENSGFELMAEGVQLAADVLPTLAPLFNATADAMLGVVEAIREWINSPEYEQMLAFFMDFGIDMLLSFLEIGGNLIRFFGHLFEAIEPFARAMMTGLEELTAGWLAWSQGLEDNQGFQTFMDNALTYGPMILDMLGSMVAAFINLGRGLEPFAGPMIQGLIAFFDMIANVDPGVITIVAGALAGLWAGFHIVAPIIGAITTALPLIATALAAISVPALIVTGLILGIAGVMVYLWQTSQTFRDAVITTWNAIRDAIQPIVTRISDLIRNNWGTISAFARGIWNDVKSIVQNAMIIVQQLVRAGSATVRYLWNAMGDGIIQTIKGAAQIIGSVVRGFFNILKGIFSLIKNVLTGNWRGAWQDIIGIGRNFVQMIVGVVRGFGNLLGGIFRQFSGLLSNIWQSIWSRLRGPLSSFFGWVRSGWNTLMGFFRGLGGTVSGIFSNVWDGIVDAFRSAINSVIGLWNNLSFGVDIPDKIPGLPSSFRVETPNVGYLAQGAYVDAAMLAVVGEGPEPEIVSPVSKMQEIVRENSGSDIDYGRMAGMIAAALASILSRMGVVTKEDIERLIDAAGAVVHVDGRGQNDNALARRIGYELRVLGYGGV